MASKLERLIRSEARVHGVEVEFRPAGKHPEALLTGPAGSRRFPMPCNGSREQSQVARDLRRTFRQIGGRP